MEGKIMETIFKPIGKGKTTEVIKKAAGYNGYIVCLNFKEVDRVAKLAKDQEIDIRFPITFDELIKGQFYGKGCKSFHIDNADMLLQQLCKGVLLETITMTSS